LVLPGDDNPWETACVPLGNLREGLSSVKRASLIVITCSNRNSAWVHDWKNIVSQVAPGVPCFVGLRKSVSVLDDQGKSVNPDQTRFGAFCGIGRPQRFMEDLSHWAPVDFLKTYRDHHAYTKDDIKGLIKLAKERAVEFLVTTEKDFFKVKDLFGEFDFPLRVAHTEYELTSEFWEILEIRLRQAC